jgi:hypothetical protein
MQGNQNLSDSGSFSDTDMASSYEWSGLVSVIGTILFRNFIFIYLFYFIYFTFFYFIIK